jgi:hypothetical protein
LACAEINKFSPYGGGASVTGMMYDGGFDFDFDFNILTAFIRLGRAGPVGAGCPSYYYLIMQLLT